MNPNPKWKYTFRAGIRLTRDPVTGLKDDVPELNSTVMLEFFNGNPKTGKEHERIDDEICYAHSNQLAVEPQRGRISSDKKLLRAKLEVRVNQVATLREQKAFRRFCDEKFAPELLDPIRLAFWSEPSRSPERIDLTKGPASDRSNANKARYKGLIKELKRTGQVNTSQLTVLNSASNMRSKIVMVQGPPGAGKRRTLRDKVIALAKIDHKVLVVASSNVAVDTDAKAVWSGLSKEERKTIKCLRLKTDGAERAQRLSKHGYGQYTGEEGEEDRMPEYRGPEQAVDNPAIRNSLDRLVVQYEARREYSEKMLATYKDVNEALKATQRYDELKQSNVEVGLALDHKMWNITQADERDAERLYAEERQRVGDQEFDRQVVSGDVSVGMYNRSFKYKHCIANYIHKDGMITRKERTELEDETDRLIERVLAETDILFTTASNFPGREMIIWSLISIHMIISAILEHILGKGRTGH